MYIKIKDGKIEKYPYSYDRLKADNPTTSFPAEPSDALLAEWGLFKVIETPQLEITYKQNIKELSPQLINGMWTQMWEISEKPQAEIDVLNEQLRSEAYRNESDPLFFKYQRGEIDKQIWLDKVAEIKARYS